jgi:iron complex outermembrane receptor protein
MYGATSLLLTTPSARAQDTAEPQVAKREVLEEVVVTAQKRTELLVDVPISMAVVNEEQIKAANAQILSDVAMSVPNVTFGAQNGKLGAVYVRGVGSPSRNIGFDTRVGVYLDGVYIGQSSQFDQDLVDIERIEVLRGPQGTLFGKNTDAGAISVISKRPSDRFEGMISVDYGNYDARVIAAKMNIPTSERSALSVAVKDTRRDGFIDNIFDGEELENRNRTQARAQFAYEPTDRFDIYLSADYFTAHELNQQPSALTNTFGNAPPDYDARFYNSNFNVLPKLERETWGAAAELNYEFGSGVQLRSISAYRDTSQVGDNDSDYSSLDLISASEGDTYEQATQEFQLLSPTGQLFEWVTGFYYYHQVASTNRNVAVGADGADFGLPVGDPVLSQTGDVTTESYSLFGNGTVNITDALAFSAGVRVETEEKKADWSQVGPLTAAVGLANGPYDRSISDDTVSSAATLTYKFDAGVSAFLRYAEGDKSGGFNLDYIAADIYPDHLEYSAESSRDYEVGLKGDFGSASFSLTGFTTDFEDFQQLLRKPIGANTALVLGNVQVETKGIEFEGTYRLTPGITINAGYAVLDATCSDCPGVLFDGSNAKGRKLPFAAEDQGFANLTLTHGLGSEGLRWSANVNYTYVGPYYTSLANRKTRTISTGPIPFDYVEERNLVNARVALFPDGGRWEVALWARNVFDEEYIYNYGQDFFGTLIVMRGDPRTYGISLTARY